MKLLAVDGNSILNRAFYGIKLLSNKNGIFTNAVYGFMNIFLKNISEIKPDAIAVAFDLPAPTFRHKAVASYKANRKGMPPELAQQLPIVKDLLSLLGIKTVECEGYEADDILGTLSRVCTEKNCGCVILTGDRDSLQLVNDLVTVRLATNRDSVDYDPAKFAGEYGFDPPLLIDLKALMGDSSDNISGVPGIGEKTASALVKEYGTVEDLYKALPDADLSKSVRAKLENGEEAAKTSKWLATIVTDAPIETDITKYKPSACDKSGVSRLLSELEMFKLLDKLKIPAWTGLASSGSQTETDISRTADPVITDERPLTEDIIDSLGKCSYLFDGNELSVCKDNSIFCSTDTDLICRFLSSPCEKTTSGSKPHYRYALTHGCEINGLVCDTELCGYLLNTSASDYSVEKLCAEYNTAYHGELKKYAALPTLGPLTEKLLDEVEKEGMGPLLRDVEMPLTQVLASMEHTGVMVDSEGVVQFGETLTGLIDETKQMIYDEAGHEFNISSPKQLGQVLFEEMGLPAGKKTKSGYSTNAEVLEQLRNYSPIVDNILKYRQYTKLNSTYVAGLLDKIADDGRIHTCFRQTETRTGRISSTEPNLQNIPVRTKLGSQMRRFFTAGEGRILVDADYSQIELRVMAHLCGDKNMISAFVNGEDIHTSTASQVFDMPPELVTPNMRNAAKAVNFGIIYGIGAFSLSKDINTSVAQAKKYINDYLEKYSDVKRFMDETVQNAEKTGVVSTMFGRKRRIPEIMSSNKNIKAAGKRIAMNTPVQGTAADLIKMAMINVYRRLKEEKLDAKLILQVHDELIVESSVGDAQKAAEILREEMQSVYEMKVPLAVDVNVGVSWYDAKGI